MWATVGFVNLDFVAEYSFVWTVESDHVEKVQVSSVDGEAIYCWWQFFFDDSLVD